MGKEKKQKKESSSSDSEEEVKKDLKEKKEVESEGEEEQQEPQDQQENDSGKRKRFDETAADRTIFVGKLAPESDESKVQKLFKKTGTVEEVRFLWKDRDNQIHKGCCFIQFSTVDEAKAAVKLNGTKLDGAELNITMAGDKPQGQQGGKSQNSIFIGGLSFNSTEDSVREAFSSYGTITRVSIPVNEEGRPKGFAFVDFESGDEAKAALEMNDQEIDGRQVRVDMGGNKSGGGRGGRGGFRGGDRGGFRGGRGGGGFRGGNRGGGFRGGNRGGGGFRGRNQY